MKKLAKDEKSKKVVTINKKNIIISQQYNNIEVNCKKYKRNMLLMKETKEGVLDKVVKTLSERYNQNEKFINLLIKMCLDFEVSDYKIIEKFLINREKGL